VRLGPAGRIARTRNLNNLLRILQVQDPGGEDISGFIIIQFSLIQLNMYLLKCRLKSTGVNYKTSTKTNKTQTQYKYIKQITKQRNQNNVAGKKTKEKY